MKVDHFDLAIKLNIDHTDAVMKAREFCPSAGEHGMLCPCDGCTTEAVLILAGVAVDRGTFTDRAEVARGALQQ